MKPFKSRILSANATWIFEKVDSAYKEKQFHMTIGFGDSENCFTSTNNLMNIKTDVVMFGNNGSNITPLNMKYCVDKEKALNLDFKMTLHDAVGADYGMEFMRDSALQFDEQIYSQGLVNLLKDAKFSDFEFVMGDNEKVAAHKAILAARSDVIDEVFSASDEIKQKEFTNIAEVSKDSFEKFLEILYGNSAMKIQRENLTDLLFLSHKFRLEDLKEKCEEAMQDELNPSTAIDFFKAATSLNLDEKLKLDSFKLIQKWEFQFYKFYCTKITFFSLNRKFLKINQTLDDSIIDDPQYVLDLVTKFQELLDSLKKRVRIEEKVEIAENWSTEVYFVKFLK